MYTVELFFAFDALETFSKDAAAVHTLEIRLPKSRERGALFSAFIFVIGKWLPSLVRA